MSGRSDGRPVGYAPTAGFTITVRSGRIWFTDQHPDRDDGRISPAEARELAQRLLCAAHAAERDRQRGPGP